MRVLILDNPKLGTTNVIEIRGIGFDETENTMVMVDTEGDSLVVDGVTIEECNTINEIILEKGFFNLRKYGEYHWL